MKGFDRDDSSELGFAVSCLFYGAITMSEFKQWVLSAIERTSEPPMVLIDLLDFSGPLAKIYEPIGFVPHWPFAESAKTALVGIAFRRGTAPVDGPLTSTEAEASLNRFPQVESRFREMFPSVTF